MYHTCTLQTDLDELIGIEYCDDQAPAFRYGPLSLAMKHGEVLVLENSGLLPLIVRAKVQALLSSLMIEETSERILPRRGFHVVYR
jgi:hypothetical protein